LYGSLASTISKQFFSGVDETTGFLFALLAFVAGFIVGPFGAAFFGRLGDLIGRKYTFLMTMFLMGISHYCSRFVAAKPCFQQLTSSLPVTRPQSRN
jgi:MFS family permease